MRPSSKQLLEKLFQRYSALLSCRNEIFNVTEMLIACFSNGHKLLTCGNGGSAADSQHIVGELMKAFVLPRKLPAHMAARIEALFPDSAKYLTENIQGALPAISLVGEAALLTAFSNDKAPNLVFAQQVYGYGCEGDVLLAISTSGNSENVVYAAQIARVLGLKTIGLTGQKGGTLRSLCDITISVPSDATFAIQEYHLPVYHALCLAVENELFGAE